jgi:hypothetical protein
MNAIAPDATDFALSVAERLIEAERRLRAAVQAQERAPHGPAKLAAEIRVSAADARTLLRAILPATLALGRTRRATLRVQQSVAAHFLALVNVREPAQLDDAITTAAQLMDELAEWIAEARWRQATRRAGVAWRRDAVAIIPVLRQSTRPKRERPANTGQRHLLLPIAGKAPIGATTTTEQERAA